MSLLFSIILPTYNRAYVLWRAITSVLAQTEPRWELIVVDDGSTDSTQRLLEEFQDARIRTIVTQNCGPAAARNVGGRVAQAPYVAYLDSDNCWRSNFLETMLWAIQVNSHAQLWYCGQRTTIWQRSAMGVWSMRGKNDESRAQYSVADVRELQGADVNCIVHRRDVLDVIGGWDELCRWLEDWDFFLRCSLRYPQGVIWVPHILVEYRQVHGTGADGICGAAREDGYQEFAGRQYLLQKWGDQLAPLARQQLSVSVADILAKRDRAARKYAANNLSE